MTINSKNLLTSNFYASHVQTFARHQATRLPLYLSVIAALYTLIADGLVPYVKQSIVLFPIVPQIIMIVWGASTAIYAWTMVKIPSATTAEEEQTQPTKIGLCICIATLIFVVALPDGLTLLQALISQSTHVADFLTDLHPGR